MAKDGPDDFKAAKRAKIKVPIEAEFERRAALPSSTSHYVREHKGGGCLGKIASLSPTDWWSKYQAKSFKELPKA